MKSIIIPKLRILEFTRKLSKYNEVVPIELKNGEFFIEDAYLKPEAMVDPELSEQTISEIRLAIKTFVIKELTEIDYKEAESIEPKIISK